MLMFFSQYHDILFSKYNQADKKEKYSMLCCKTRCPKLMQCGHCCPNICHSGACAQPKECVEKKKLRCACGRRKKVRCFFLCVCCFLQLLYSSCCTRVSKNIS